MTDVVFIKETGGEIHTKVLPESYTRQMAEMGFHPKAQDIRSQLLKKPDVDTLETLRARAQELGLNLHPQTGEKKLRDAIADAEAKLGQE